MKTHILWALIASLTLVSCTIGPNARTGTVVGALGGAAAGGIIGHQSGRGLEGAAIGGGLGALGGNLIGGAQDQRNEEYYYRHYDNLRYQRIEDKEKDALNTRPNEKVRDTAEDAKDAVKDAVKK